MATPEPTQANGESGELQPKFSGVPLLSRSVMLLSAASEYPNPTNREIIFEEFQHAQSDNDQLAIAIVRSV